MSYVIDKPFGNQILVKPVAKPAVAVGDTGSFCEYGEVIDIGDKVEKIRVGDVIGHTVWGVNSLEIDGIKHYFIPEDERFILTKLRLS